MSKIQPYLLWFLLTAAHSWLFFQEDPGFNALVFSLTTVLIVTVQHRLWNKKRWWLVAGGHLVAAIGVCWHSSFEAVSMYYFSSFLIAGVVFADNSMLVAVANGAVASLVAFFAAIPRFHQEMHQSRFLHHFFLLFGRRKAYLYAAPATITFIFYMLYCAVNPDFLLSISLPEWQFDVQLALYTSFGLIVLCPLFFPWGFGRFSELDQSAPDVLLRHRTKKGNTGTIGLSYENKQGVIMFAMLNVLIGLFLIFNTLQIFVSSLQSPEATHSEQVHQGFWAVVVSILVAILLIMYYFRGNQNFLVKNRRLIQGAAIWVVLNAFLAFFTTYKNILYVDAYGLTYKRIWVFIGMALTLTGLALTLIKVFRIKTNWYLVRRNTWVLYSVLAVYTVVDWDRLIAWYNPNYAQKLDLSYIFSLGDSKLPYLKEMVDRGDDRILARKADVEEMITMTHWNSKSWKSQTLDKMWLEASLRPEWDR